MAFVLVLISPLQAVPERGCPDPAFIFAKHLLEKAFDGDFRHCQCVTCACVSAYTCCRALWSAYKWAPSGVDPSHIGRVPFSSVLKLVVESGCAAEKMLCDCTGPSTAAFVGWALILLLAVIWVCAGARESHLELWAAVLRWVASSTCTRLIPCPSGGCGRRGLR